MKETPTTTPDYNYTAIHYLYRDASNYKTGHNVLVKGVLTDEQIQEILDSLQDGEYFNPDDLKVPEIKRITPDGKITEDDHPFCELCEYDFEPIHIDEPVKSTVKVNGIKMPVISVGAKELVERFKACRDKWTQEL